MRQACAAIPGSSEISEQEADAGDRAQAERDIAEEARKEGAIAAREGTATRGTLRKEAFV